MPSLHKLGLVLGGGGARGIAHLGVLKVFEREGIRPDRIVGVSFGAAVGAATAIGLPVEHLIDELKRITSRRLRILKFLDLNRPSVSVIRGQAIRRYLNELYDGAAFDQVKIPLRIAVTDLENGRMVMLRQGDIAEAVLASVSVPGIFPPVPIGNRLYIDGGVINPTPIEAAKKFGADRVIAVDLTMRKLQRLTNPGLLTTLYLSYEIVRTASVHHTMLAHTRESVIITPNARGMADSFNFKAVDQFIRAGEEAAEKALPKIEKLLA